MLALSELARKTFDTARRDTQAVHAGVHLQVERNAFAAFLAAFLRKDAGGGAIELFQLLAAMYHCRQIVFDEARFFTGEEARQHENRLADAGLAHGDAFFRARDTEPVRAGLFQRFGDLRAAMAIAVSFDDAKNFARRFALLFGGIHEVADGAEILRQRAKINFRPNRPSCFVAGPLLCACHVPSEKFSLRHPAAASRQRLWMPRE